MEPVSFDWLVPFLGAVGANFGHDRSFWKGWGGVPGWLGVID